MIAIGKSRMGGANLWAESRILESTCFSLSLMHSKQAEMYPHPIPQRRLVLAVFPTLQQRVRTKITAKRRLERAHFAINPLPTYPTPIVFSSGATVHIRTSLRPDQMRDPFIRLVKDRHSHPLWNPGKQIGLEDESGKLKKFESRFGEMLPDESAPPAEEGTAAPVAEVENPAAVRQKQKERLDAFYGDVMEGLNDLEMEDLGTRRKKSRPQ